ncbi:sugar transporter [Cryptococcus deuterogattii CA1014]|nr:sugar transporter [Cryptococcus deuterogattii CA1014]
MNNDGEDKYDLEHVEDNVGEKVDTVAEAFDKGQTATGYESLGILETVKTFKMASAICFAATFAAAADGYQIGMNGNIIANQGFINQFATTVDNKTGEPILSASVLTAIGTIHLAARFGRKPAMFALWAVLVASVLCESLAKKWQIWFLAKLFSGIGVGSLQFITPTYVTEVAPIRIRGCLLMLYNFWFSLGNFFAPVALQWGHIGLMLVIYLLLPESPAWCATRGLEEKAKKNMQRIYRGVTDFDVDVQYEGLVRAVQHEEAVAAEYKRLSWYNIFRGVDGFRTIVSTWALFSQQLLGLTLFNTYSSYFFQIAGFDDPFAITCISTGIQLGVILVVVALVDKVGRRNLCCGGLTTMLVGNTLIGILGVVKSNNVTNKLLVFFTCVYMVGLQCSGSTGWGYVGEISSQRLRAHTAGFGAALSCVMGVIMNVLVPYMLNTNEWNWGLKTAFFYLGVGGPFAVGSWFIIPETKGRSAAELDELFEMKARPWRFHKTQTALQKAIEQQL